MDRKAEFLKIWTERVQRDYADALLAWLERETDFFEAPASTRHHGAHPGGLLEHSLDNAAKGDGRALSAAMAASPWVWRLQQADMCAAWVDEREAAEE